MNLSISSLIIGVLLDGILGDKIETTDQFREYSMIPKCPGRKLAVRDVNGKPLACLPGQASMCPDGSRCWFNGFNFLCCPMEMTPLDVYHPDWLPEGVSTTPRPLTTPHRMAMPRHHADFHPRQRTMSGLLGARRSLGALGGRSPGIFGPRGPGSSPPTQVNHLSMSSIYRPTMTKAVRVPSNFGRQAPGVSVEKPVFETQPKVQPQAVVSPLGQGVQLSDILKLVTTDLEPTTTAKPQTISTTTPPTTSVPTTTTTTTQTTSTTATTTTIPSTTAVQIERQSVQVAPAIHEQKWEPPVVYIDSRMPETSPPPTWPTRATTKWNPPMVYIDSRMAPKPTAASVNRQGIHPSVVVRPAIVNESFGRRSKPAVPSLEKPVQLTEDFVVPPQEAEEEKVILQPVMPRKTLELTALSDYTPTQNTVTPVIGQDEQNPKVKVVQPVLPSQELRAPSGHVPTEGILISGTPRKVLTPKLQVKELNASETKPKESEPVVITEPILAKPVKDTTLDASDDDVEAKNVNIAKGKVVLQGKHDQNSNGDSSKTLIVDHLMNGYPYNEYYYYPERELLAAQVINPQEHQSRRRPIQSNPNHRPRVFQREQHGDSQDRNAGHRVSEVVSAQAYGNGGRPNVANQAVHYQQQQNNPQQYNYDYVRWMTRYGTRWYK